MNPTNEVQCSPLHSLAELNAWEPPEEAEAALKAASVCLPPSTSICGLPYVQKMLFCHDMAGGYKEDKWAQGCSESKAFSFWHWQCVDLFIYFSHAMVAIPPVGWINAAHRNGAAMLGTFILEWEAGAAICKDLFCGKEPAEHAAKQLAKIAAWYGFEGWLVNIESHVGQGVLYLDAFLRTLTSEMHSLRGNQGIVLWYDACDSTGEVHHWCTLNFLNYPFFQACSGVFVDYHWNDTSCRTAQQFVEARRSAGSCEHGPGDIWMGVDVFGRGTFGGGGWNTNVGVAHAQEAGLSVALFAPGWYYEHCGPDQWQGRAQEFWQKVQTAWHKARVTVRELPLSTSFNTGSGENFYQAAVAAQGPWYNLSFQDIQPLWLPVEPSRAESSLAQLSSTLNHLYGWSSNRHGQLVLAQDHSTVYDGGCSLHCTGSMTPGALKVVPLYACDVPAPPTLHVEYVYRTGSGTAAAIAVVLAGKEGHECHVLVPTDEVVWQQIIGCEDFPCDTSCLTFVYQEEPDDPAGEEPDVNGWRRCSFIVQCNPAHDKLVSMGLIVSCQEADDGVAETAQTGSDVSVHIGCLLLCEPSACAQAVPSGLLLDGPVQKNSDGGHCTISCCLQWEMPGDSRHLSSFRYAVWARFRTSLGEFTMEEVATLDQAPVQDLVLVGLTHRPKYFVASMTLPQGTSSVTYLVQPRFFNGKWLPVEQCPGVDVVL